MVKTFNLIIPRKDDLRCMVCNIVNRRNDPMIKYPEYWRNKLKYRRFLDEIPEVMAAPKDFRDGVIYVIVAKDVFERSFATFRDDCMALDIQIVEQLHPISDSIYEMCLHNTVEHKLLLHWNAVGKFLVEGSDFLNSMRSVNAIKLNINIRDNNTQLRIKAFNLQIPFLELEGRDFQLPYLVNILPSLAEVKAITRREAIQEHSGNLFVNYEDLREFWRKMNGYTLPVNEKGLLFYDVQFFKKVPGRDIPLYTMVYPEICLTSIQQNTQPLTPFPLENNAATRIYENFVRDLRGRVPTLCGHELVYSEVNTNCISYNIYIYQIQSNN